jgi:hypothetical protein
MLSAPVARIQTSRRKAMQSLLAYALLSAPVARSLRRTYPPFTAQLLSTLLRVPIFGEVGLQARHFFPASFLSMRWLLKSVHKVLGAGVRTHGKTLQCRTF